MRVEDIYTSEGQKNRGVFTPAKKIDLGNSYLIFVSGQQVDKNENNEAITDDIEQQTENVFENIEKILKIAGASMDDVVKSEIFLTDIEDFKKMSMVRDKWFSKCKPTSTLAVVNGLTRKGAKVEIEVTAIIQK